MPRFQLEVTLSGNGYVELEAKDINEAMKELRRFPPAVHWGRAGIDTSMFDDALNMRIERVTEVVEEQADAQ